MIFTIDPYYNIQFFNRTLEALKNNKVNFELFVDSKSPYYFYIDCPIQPVFLDYDVISSSRERNLVSLVQPLTPQSDYKYLRRSSHTGKKGLEHYSTNDVFAQMNKTKEGVIFQMTAENAFKVSKKYPRKIWFLGRYLSNSYTVFAQDSLIIKNYLHKVPHRILQEGKSFNHSTELEQEVNYKIFSLRDRIIKLDETPFLNNGKLTNPRVRNEYQRKFILESDSGFNDQGYDDYDYTDQDYTDQDYEEQESIESNKIIEVTNEVTN